MLHSRGSIAVAAVMVALLSPGSADAQVAVVVPSPPQHPDPRWGTFANGVQLDIAKLEWDERQLEKTQEKLRFDAAQGDTAAAEQDARRINHLRFRIAAQEWLIRKNMLCDPGCYPLRIDTMSLCAINMANRPAPPVDLARLLQTPGSMEPAFSTFMITITNAKPAGDDDDDGLDFAIDGVSHKAAAGSRQTFSLTTGSKITYDAGGSLGQREYRITRGLYEFRSTPEGWALYKLPSTSMP